MYRAFLLLVVSGFLAPAFPQVPSGSAVRMTRSLSGPSGKLVGQKFVLDEVRNRFVFPQDSSLTVYFEFEAPKGDYTLTAYWKDPQGRVAGISPDIRIQTETEQLPCYWLFMIDAQRASGIWTVEVRVNGEPAGSHAFELVVPEAPREPVVESPVAPTLDEIYRAAGRSLVWVHKLDAGGQRIDSSSGFVAAPGAVLTAFQSIDMGARLEIHFADGSKSVTDRVLALNRLQDWALVGAETRAVPPLEKGKSADAVIGGQAIVFGIGAGTTRTIGAVDVTGRGATPGFGERIHINPQLPPAAIGSPLLDLFGRVLGVIGGSTMPGTWVDHRSLSIDAMILSPTGGMMSVTPIDGIPLEPVNPPSTLREMLESGLLTPPVAKAPVFSFGALTDRIEADLSYVSKSRFRRKGSGVVVYTIWEGKPDVRRGLVSIAVYDAANRMRTKGEPTPLKLPKQGMVKCVYTLSPAALEPGVYRVDLLWDGIPTWRSNFAIVE